MAGRRLSLPQQSAVYRDLRTALCCLSLHGAGMAPFLRFSSDSWLQACGQTNISCKMVKGKLVEVGKWPWQASILFLGMYICSGSLIHHQWILTAAHCLQRSVRVASQSRVQRLPENGTQLLVTRIVIHEGFNNLISQDVALLKLRDPVSWSPLIQPVCLPSTNFKPSIGTMCWVIGQAEPPYSLQEVAVKIINSNICNQRYQFLFLKGQKKFIGNDMLCASSEWGVDSCQGMEGACLHCKSPGRGFSRISQSVMCVP
uniref:Peptidase S1 domain-containing protein n=1 Tax=Equus asinus asinus TaxID=83772 RepID=A0A8C4PK41_EQUAS